MLNDIDLNWASPLVDAFRDCRLCFRAVPIKQWKVWGLLMCLRPSG